MSSCCIVDAITIQIDFSLLIVEPVCQLQKYRTARYKPESTEGVWQVLLITFTPIFVLFTPSIFICLKKWF